MPDETEVCVVFDLDDTLYKEHEFVLSAYNYIAGRLPVEDPDHWARIMYERFLRREDVFDWLIEMMRPHTEIAIESLLHDYRYHFPSIALETSAKECINKLLEHNVKLGIITDGRSITQRNKIKALGIEDKMSCIVISEEIGSEKPDLNNFRAIQEGIVAKYYYYVADNTKKDFVAPYQLDWRTVCIRDNGMNIHKQDLNLLNPDTVILNSVAELSNVILSGK